jgi:hypothetical protein
MAVGGSDGIVDIVKKFSPISNECPHIKEDTQTRVLVTTDVLSEGQNLQDAHIIVNFDLPWALVRLVQRAGRVDRLGQKSRSILCYSFLPEKGIEEIIGLRKKLKQRIRENAEVVGSDEEFFEGDPINISDLYNEKSGIFDDEEDEAEVDLGSHAYQIWKNAIDANPDLKAQVESLPDVVFSAKENLTTRRGDGAIVYARTKDDNDALAWLDSSGNIVTQSQYAILKAAECNFYAPALSKLAQHHELVKMGLAHIQKEANTVTGALGRKNSVKYRVYMRLKRFFDEHENSLFVPHGLKFALDEIYQRTLKEGAINTLSRQMRSGAPDEDLAGIVVSLHESGALCNVSAVAAEQSAAQIICSLGLIDSGSIGAGGEGAK